MDNLYVVIPLYNEEDNVEELVKEWHEIVEKHNTNGGSRLAIIDDGSRDSSFRKLIALRKEYPLLLPLPKMNEGHGATVLYGYDYALRNGADYIFQTDSDRQTDPKEFEPFWEKREEYDAQFGNRTVRGDGKDRALVERTLCNILKVIFGVNIPDANAPYRLMKAEYVKKYLEKIPKKYNLPNVLLTTFGAYYKDNIRFIPITFKKREKGTNSINVKKITKIGVQAVKDFREIRSRM